MNNDKIWSSLPFRDNDIIIASTIKSGTTWLQQIISQLVFKGNFNGKMNNVSIWLDTLRNLNEEEIIELIEKQEHRRFLKTHSPASIVLNNRNKNTKYIFITRDFRDVVWSFYNHFINSKYVVKENNEFIDTIRRMKKSSNPYEFWNITMENIDFFKKCKSYKIIWSYFHTIKTWLENKNNDNILILHFNDLKKDLKGNIIKISEFLGYDYDEEIMDEVYKKSTFEWMKDNSKKCAPVLFKNNSSNFINKGTNKRWKNSLTQDDILKYKNLIKSFFSENETIWIENGGLLPT